MHGIAAVQHEGCGPRTAYVFTVEPYLCTFAHVAQVQAEPAVGRLHLGGCHVECGLIGTGSHEYRCRIPQRLPALHLLQLDGVGTRQGQRPRTAQFQSCQLLHGVGDGSPGVEGYDAALGL